MVIWIFGRPGSGKTTLGKKFCSKSKNAVLLDGDDLRAIFDYHDFSEEGRKKWIHMVAKLAFSLERQGFFPIVALVSPYKESRLRAKKLFKNFKLIYLTSDTERMWEGSVFEEPDDDEPHVHIDRCKGKSKMVK